MAPSRPLTPISLHDQISSEIENTEFLQRRQPASQGAIRSRWTIRAKLSWKRIVVHQIEGLHLGVRRRRHKPSIPTSRILWFVQHINAGEAEEAPSILSNRVSSSFSSEFGVSESPLRLNDSDHDRAFGAGVRHLEPTIVNRLIATVCLKF